MEKWARFIFKGDLKFGKVSDDESCIEIYEGDLFNSPISLKETVKISDIKLKIYIETMNEIKAVHRMYHITLG